MSTPSDQTHPVLPDFLVTDTTRQTQSVIVAQPAQDVGKPRKLTPLNAQDEEYWNKLGLSPAYQKGVLFGTGDYTNLNMADFFKKGLRMFENIIKEKLIEKDVTFENFKDEAKILEAAYGVILRHLADNKIDVNHITTIVAYHGFINAYIDSLQNG